MLALVTTAIYWPATRCDFVNLDDPVHVTAVAQVQKGLSLEGIRWAFLNPVATNWHPLTVLSHMLDCQIFGLQPWGHHLANVLLHALNAGLVFLLLQQLTKATWRSLWVAAFFAVHPLRVESVTWVTERKDVLSGFFGLLALMAYARYAQERMQNAECRMQKPEAGSPWSVVSSRWSVVHLPSSIFYLLSLSLFALGLLSKPMLVTWPFVMLLLDYWPLGRLRNAECTGEGHAPRFTFHVSRFTPHTPLLLEKLPFFALAALASVVTFIVQRRGGALAAGENLSLGVRLGNALISYCRYLGKLFWPADLAVVYPHPGLWPLWQVLVAAGLILGISMLVWVARRRHPYLLGGWLWYCGTLVPVSQVIQTGAHAMADRWTYIPSIGVLILAVWGACELTRRWRYQSLGLSVASAAAIVLCIALTRHQIGYWRDSEALLRHALAVTANNYLAHGNLGAALEEKGRMDEAIGHYQEALRLKPGFVEAHNNLGAALSKKGQIDAAIRQYQEALRLKPDYVDALNNLGVALDKKGQTEAAIRQFREALRLKPGHALAFSNLGAALSKQGQLDEAIRQYQEAISLDPGYAQVHCDLGVALSRKGQFDEAIRQYREALRLKPDLADAHNNLGAAFDKKGQTDEAIRQFREAIRLEPDHADAYNNLGIALQKQGQTDEAIRQLQQALRLKPDHVEAHYNLGVALGSKGQVDEAIHQLQETLRLRPDHAQAHNSLGIAFYLQGRIGEAIQHFQEALRLKPDYPTASNNLRNALLKKGQADGAAR